MFPINRCHQRVVTGGIFQLPLAHPVMHLLDLSTLVFEVFVMNRFILAGLAANLFGLATLGLFGGALICVIIDKGMLAGQLALGGVGAALATGGSFAYAASNMGKASNSMLDQMNRMFDDN